MKNYIQKQRQWNAYQPPDVFNPDLHPPPGAIDVLNIVEAGVEYKSVLAPDYITGYYNVPKFANPPKVTPGKGVRLDTKVSDNLCDGSVDSFCNRGGSNPCLLYGHNDGRNGLFFDGYSGWVVFNIPDLKNGLVVIKFESWHAANATELTQDWTSINNENGRALSSSVNHNNSTVDSSTDWYDNRSLGKKGPPPFCEEFQFEYAIDGVVTSLNKEQYEERRQGVQRVVETITLLDDPDFSGGEEKEVEIAIRMTGCAQLKTFKLTHVYWS